MIKNKLHIFFLLVSITAFAQHKQLLYNFSEIPQSQLLNPATELPYRLHVGIPALSGIYASYGANNFALEDLFIADNIPFETKMNSLLARTANTDYISVNQQIELLNIGFAKDDETYFSMGWYEEFDYISYMPKDLLDLIYYGNHPDANRVFKASDLNFKMELLGVLHFGITKHLSDRFTIGGRFKIYSSVLNVNSTHNEGEFTTVVGNNNIYQHILSNADINIKTAGFGDEAPNVGSFLLGGSKGLGVDFGFTWHPEEQWTVTGSMQDLGMIFNKKDSKQFYLKGSYTFEGFDLLYPGTSANDYWQEVNDEIDERIDNDENDAGYTTWRSTKIYSSIGYSFGKEKSKVCNCGSSSGDYTSEVGFQTYTIFRPKRPQYALTAYVKHTFANFLTAKVAYTYDEYSPANLGLGLAMKIGGVNLYATMDNMLGLQDLTRSKGVAVMFGINVALKKKELY